MKVYRIEQKWHFFGERFEIIDRNGQLAFYVEGSFFTFPKQFKVYKPTGQLVSQIFKPPFSFLPTFHVQLQNGSHFQINQRLSWFNTRYEVEQLGLSIEGDFWNFNLKLYNCFHRLIADIHQNIWQLISTYDVAVYTDTYTDLVISLVIAINDMKEMKKSRRNQNVADQTLFTTI